ncbi:cysteine-rich DPF motif domain-containing protein 1 [Drosophila santomea]|uniref:cysteine-rich DPF motif domain-containing protein 1 n=1 Tax=Drosophila santomea TaxID=129105 RepID=UPI0019535105|nr:cysteine-rich DPF motif domain-containing protein 1 [Drosophila santomea]
MDDDEDFVLDNEAEEIKRLQLPEEEKKPIDPEEADERIARIEFNCSGCEMHEMVHYFGRKPPFALGVEYPEDNYVMRDPFQPPPPRWQTQPEYYITLGTKCSTCSKSVCKDPGCSFYYTASFCLPCGKEELKNWPVEAQARIRKQLSASPGNQK